MRTKAEKTNYDVIVIGAGAAGLMCAATAGNRKRSVCLIDHAKKIGEKIRISGGGRCNFTNLYIRPEAYISQNPHFCKSAISQYTQNDFISLVEKHKISYHEKTLGQLFCDDKAQDIIDMLIQNCTRAGVVIRKDTVVQNLEMKQAGGFIVQTNGQTLTSETIVIATGALSIPKIGATGFGYDVAVKAGMKIIPTRPALVPLTFSESLREQCKSYSGISFESEIMTQDKKTAFREGMLFTHKGLSGPSILQISSYWKEGKDILINMLPNKQARSILRDMKRNSPKRDVVNCLSDILPSRIADFICTLTGVKGRLADLSHADLDKISDFIHEWAIKPSGTEGYKKAEVTLGGVDTNDLSSKTMESKKRKGLFFIGEVVDVTGHLGGYNFQWAWSSGYVAGMNA